MSATRYGVSPWSRGRVARARGTLLRQRGDTSADVVVVGGGLTGCATAYVLSVAGFDTVLLEEGRLGHGATIARTGRVLQEPTASYRALEKAYGRRLARHVWRETRRAMLDAAATLRRLTIHCQLDSHPTLAVTRDARRIADLRREQTARRAVGLDAVWMGASRLTRMLDMGGAGAIGTHGNLQLDPYRACLGLATAATRRGARVYERSGAARIRSDTRGVVVQTAGGQVRAAHAVMATGTASPLFPSLTRHLAVSHTYMVATPPLGASLRRHLGDRPVLMWDDEEPAHYLRWTKERRLIYGGADQAPTHPRRQKAVLVQRAGALMYELSTVYPDISGLRPEYAWHRLVTTARDGLPFIGAHRSYPRRLFALGHGDNGVTMAFVAARLIARAVRDEAEKGDEYFGFERLRKRR